jgi:putative oxidoreductase
MTRFRPRMATLLAIPVAVLLLVAGFTHLDNSYRFYDAVLSYRIVGPDLGVWIAGFLPFLQIAIGIGLLFDRRARPTAFGLSTLLFAGFVAVQASAWFRKLDIACGCFGSSDRTPIGWQSIGIAVFGLVCSIAGWWMARRENRHGHS